MSLKAVIVSASTFLRLIMVTPERPGSASSRAAVPNTPLTSSGKRRNGTSFFDSSPGVRAYLNSAPRKAWNTSISTRRSAPGWR